MSTLKDVCIVAGVIAVGVIGYKKYKSARARWMDNLVKKSVHEIIVQPHLKKPQ